MSDVPIGSARVWTGVAAAMLALVAATLALPFDPYVAWRQADGTQMFHARWIYERLHHDRAPIEVAVIGSSRLEAGISPRVLATALGRELGRPVAVANLSLVMPGRDLSWLIARELFATHPEVRLVLLSDDGDVINSHPMFRETAPAAALASAPLLVNTRYAANLLALPYRNLSNAVQAWRPGWFGLTPGFDAHAYLGTDLDRTTGYRLPDGSRTNGDLGQPSAVLADFARFAVERQRAGLRPFRLLPARWAFAVDHRYVANIAALAAAHRARVAFIGLPLFGPVQSPGGTDFYTRFGPDIRLTALAADPSLFQNGAHLNRRGAVVASQEAAHALAPLLRGARAR